MDMEVSHSLTPSPNFQVPLILFSLDHDGNLITLA